MEGKIPNSLITALKSKQIIPFTGAGVSRAVQKKDKVTSKTFDPLFPNWKEYIEILAQTLADEGKPAEGISVNALVNRTKPKYLEAMQDAFEELGSALWYQKLNEYFKKAEGEAALNSLELPQLIWELGSNVVFTTNVDRVLEWKSVKDAAIDILDTQKVEQAELLQNTEPPPTLFYLHGRIGDKANIVFTRDQYDAFYKNNINEAKLRVLQTFLTTKSFLFIGFSLDDIYFVEQLKYIHEVFKGGTRQYYALIKKSEAGRLRELEFVTEVYFEDFGEPLLKVMREMRDIANNKIPNGKIFSTINKDSETKKKSTNSKNWNEIFNKVFSIINTSDHNYFKGVRFINLVREIDRDFSDYKSYIKQRQANSEDTSRKDYFRDIFFTLDENQRFDLVKKIVKETYANNLVDAKELDALLGGKSIIPINAKEKKTEDIANTSKKVSALLPSTKRIIHTKLISQEKQFEDKKNVQNQPSPRIVFVIHGRNSDARNSLFAFLRSIGLHPLEWSEAVSRTSSSAPYVDEVLNIAFSQAQAIVVLFTPDDVAMLQERFRSENEEQYETKLTPQARLNVIFEAGIAMGKFPERTILVELGKLRPFSDIGGRHKIRLNDSIASRQDLAQRLEIAGCDIDFTGLGWHTAGNFDISVLATQSIKKPIPEVETQVIDSTELEEADIRVLKAFADYSTWIFFNDLVVILNMHKLQLEHSLDKLVEFGYLEVDNHFAKDNLYKLMTKGRSFIIKNKLI